MERRHKVEELKKKTDYYSTQKLLERYDQLVRRAQHFGSPEKRLICGARRIHRILRKRGLLPLFRMG